MPPLADPVRFSKRARDLSPSATLALSAKARELKRQGKPIISLTAGEPDFDTPEPVKEAAARAMREGFTKYTAAEGILELREAVCQTASRLYGLNHRPEEVIVCNGAKHALFNVLFTLCDEGDEVVFPAPYWVSYPDLVRVAGARPVVIPSDGAGRFSLDRLKEVTTDRTRMLILNSPNNPAGFVYDRAWMREVAEFCVRRGIWILSDEIYDRLVYDGACHVPVAALSAEVRARTVWVGSVSKTYAMTGWRIGYAVGPAEVIRACAVLQSQTASNANSIAQKAAVAALRMPDRYIEEIRTLFDERRRLLWSRLRGIDGVHCVEPRGAFYVFADVRSLLERPLEFKGRRIERSEELAAWLLEEAFVAAVPGEPFGAPGYLRFSYALDVDSLREAAGRLEKAFSEMRIATGTEAPCA
jgi:aspartate aminotransferase